MRVSPPLAALEALSAEGFPVDSRAFRPHITLARGARNAAPPEVAKSAGIAEAVSLMKSERADGRLVYTALYTRRMEAEGARGV